MSLIPAALLLKWLEFFLVANFIELVEQMLSNFHTIGCNLDNVSEEQETGKIPPRHQHYGKKISRKMEWPYDGRLLLEYSARLLE